MTDEQIMSAYYAKTRCCYLGQVGSIVDLDIADGGMTVYFRPNRYPPCMNVVISGVEKQGLAVVEEQEEQEQAS